MGGEGDEHKSWAVGEGLSAKQGPRSWAVELAGIAGELERTSHVIRLTQSCYYRPKHKKSKLN